MSLLARGIQHGDREGHCVVRLFLNETAPVSAMAAESPKEVVFGDVTFLSRFAQGTGHHFRTVLHFHTIQMQATTRIESSTHREVD